MSGLSDKRAVALSKPNAGKCRLAILDDQPIFCEGVKRLLDQVPNMEVVGVFDRKAAAQSFLHGHEADLLLVELNLRHEVGLELIKDMRAAFDKLRILVFTDRDEMIYGERVLLAGAQGYLMKNCSQEELVNAIGTVMRGEIVLSERLMAHLIKRNYLGGQAKQAASTNPVASLTDREFGVMELIGRGKGTREIAASLNLSIKTVENHREKIKRKLGLNNGASLVHYATIWVYESISCKEIAPEHANEDPTAGVAVALPLSRLAWNKRYYIGNSGHRPGQRQSARPA